MPNKKCKRDLMKFMVSPCTNRKFSLCYKKDWKQYALKAHVKSKAEKQGKSFYRKIEVKIITTTHTDGNF
jgi:hypothetical protein